MVNLDLEGYGVDFAVDGIDALEQFNKSDFDLVLLDVMLPYMDGFEVCKKIRENNSTVPILFLTARDQSDDRIQGLKLGGDDYLAKPFNLEELLLRVKNLLKRNNYVQKNTPFYEFGGNKINFSTYQITDKQGVVKQVSDREINLLKLLIENEGKVVSRNDILDKVWGYENFPTTRTIDNYILMFRKYFEEDPKNPKYFHSIRSVGYKFTAG